MRGNAIKRIEKKPQTMQIQKSLKKLMLEALMINLAAGAGFKLMLSRDD